MSCGKRTSAGAPSSVTIIAATEIRATGHRARGGALRRVRSLFVTYDINRAYAGVRELRRPADPNIKVPLSIGGHPLNRSVYGEALVEPEPGVNLEGVERLVVVRGLTDLVAVDEKGDELHGNRAREREPGVEG